MKILRHLLYLPECREILWFSYGSAAGYGGYAGYGGGGYGGGGGGGYGEISTFVCYLAKNLRFLPSMLVCRVRLSVCAPAPTVMVRFC